MHRQQARRRVGRSARIPMQIKKRNNPCAYGLIWRSPCALKYARQYALLYQFRCSNGKGRSWCHAPGRDQSDQPAHGGPDRCHVVACAIGRSFTLQRLR